METLEQMRIFVSGHRHPLGQALVSHLRQAQAGELLLRGPRQLDLRDGGAVEAFFATQKPDAVALMPDDGSGAPRASEAERLHDTVTRVCNVARAAERHGTRKLVHVVSDEIYPQDALQPLREDALWSGPLGTQRRAEGLASLLAVELCDALRRDAGADFVSAVLPRTFGPAMSFEPDAPNPVATLVRQAHEARVRDLPQVRVPWRAEARLESLFAADAADGLMFVLRGVSASGPVHVASGADLSLTEWAERVREVVGYRGRIDFTGEVSLPRRVLDGSRLSARGWRPETDLHEALERTYAGYLERYAGRAPHRSGARPASPQRLSPGRL